MTPARLWTEPGAVATALLGALLVTFALSVDFPKAAFAFQSDEATYYSMAYSLARDGDLAYERRDLERVWREFPTGPEGIFLKRGREIGFHIDGRFPFVHLDQRPDSHNDRAYYAKSFVYPLAAAPFVFFFGTNGFLLLQALLLTIAFAAAYAFLRARASPVAAISYALVFFIASAAPVYLVWLTPEIFNLSVAVCALFLWSYKEVAPPLDEATTPAPANRWIARWSRFLRSPASTYAAAALVGIATFSKPPYVALIAPMLALALWRRQWRFVIITAGVCAIVSASFFTWNLLVTGEFNYQGGDRNTFYGGSGFPFQTANAPFKSATGPIERGRSGLLTDVLFSRDALLSVFPRNVVYFFLGRHTGLVPYFFPGVLSLILFFATRDKSARASWQWLVVATFFIACIGMLLLVPYTYSGGGGPIGNRYFMGFYPLLLFVTPALRHARAAIIAMVIGGLFTAQLVLNPFYVSYHPAEHMKAGLFRVLPVELTLLNDLPINVTPSRIKQPLPAAASGAPPTLAYFLDDNAYPLEGDWFWVHGASRTEILLRAPAVPRADGGFDTLRIHHLTIQLESGDAATQVTIRSSADRSRVSLEPHATATVTLPLGGGVPYHKDPGLPTSYVYWLSIESSDGFIPMFSAGTRDSRYLGARVHITPSYQPTQ